MISPTSHASTQRRRIVEGILVALAAPGLAIAIGKVASLQDRPGSSGLFVLAVAIATYVGGIWAGLLASAVSFVALDYFFVAEDRWVLTGASDLVGLGAFVVAVAFVGIALERRRRARAKLGAEQRLGEALEQTETGTWELDVDTDEMRWSENLGPIHGLARGLQPATQQEFLELIHEEDRARISAALEQAVTAGKDFDLEVRIVRPDGDLRWISAQASVIMDETRRPRRIVGLTRDITDRKRTEERQRLMARANEVLSASNIERAIADVTRMALPTLGDWCAVDLVDEGGSIVSAATTHVDPLKVGLAHELRERFPPAPSAAVGAANVIRTGKLEFYPEVSGDLLERLAQGPEHLEIVRSLGFRSAMIVPLATGGETFGAITFAGAKPHRRYDQQDLDLALDLARRMAIAIENARLHRSERQARRKAEEGTRQVQRLQALTAHLSAAVLPAQIGEIVVREGSESLGAVAGWISVLLPDGHTLERLAAFGYGADFAERFRRIPLDAPLAVAEVARTGEPLWLETTEGEDQHPELEEGEDATGGRALAIVPLISGDRPFGFMALRFPEARPFPESERALLLVTARQCADALRRSQLFELEQRTRREFRRIQEITAALSAIAGVEEVAGAVLDNALRVLDARTGVLALVDPADGMLEVVRSKGYEGLPQVPQRMPLDSPLPIARAVRTGELVAHESLELRRSAYELSEELREATGPGTVAAVPLMLGEHAVGALSFSLESARELADTERSFLESLSRQAGQAVERARLYEAERESREHLQRLQNVTAALSAAASIEQIADAVVDEGLGALGARTGVFGIVEGDELVLIRRSGYEGAPFPERLKIADDWPITHAVHESRTIELETLAERTARYRVPDEVWEKAGKGVLVAVPVMVDDRPAAAFGFTLDRGGTLKARQRIFVEALTVLACQALERAQLFEREQLARREAERSAETMRTLQAIAEIGLAARSLDELLDPLLVFLRDAVGGDHAAVLLRDPDRGDLYVQAAIGFDDPEFEMTRVPWGEGIAGRIAASGEPLITEDVLAARPVTSYLRRSGGSLIGVPLHRGRETIGVLHVGSFRTGAFGPTDVALLELAAERAALAVERTALFEREHEVAVTLQRSVLPETVPHPVGAKIATRYVPGSSGLEVGGDWYDVIELDGGSLGLVVGDVVGKGVAAAATMAQLRNALRVYALEGLRPASVLARLNRLVETTGPAFATLFFATLDPETLVCRYASAGHPPPVLVRDADGGASLLEGGRSVPLGVHGDPPYRQETVELGPGDRLLLYTDGLVERRGVPLDDSLEQLLTEAARAPADPDGLLERLLEVFGDEHGDDVALLAYRPMPRGAPLELRLPLEPSSLARVRHELRVWLALAGARETDIQEIVLACSEACSNAVEHAQEPEPTEIVVTAQLDGEDVRITVRDFGHWLEPPAPGDRGLGLRLMRETMDDVEVESDGDGGTAVRLRRRLGPRVTIRETADHPHGTV